MPRYFFNVHDLRHFPDTEGTHLDNPDAARFEAVVLAGCILRDYASDVLTAENWHVAVADENGSTIFRLNVSADEDAEETACGEETAARRSHGNT